MTGEEDRIRCDGIGCSESHPRRHDQLGEFGFGIGRWLGWVYVDLNRPDIIDRQMRFCSFSCCIDWMLTRGRPESRRDNPKNWDHFRNLWEMHNERT